MQPTLFDVSPEGPPVVAKATTRRAKKSDAAFAERLNRVLRFHSTYGQLERAAGVADRFAFWRGKTEEQARAELREMIAERLRVGEIDDAVADAR